MPVEAPESVPVVAVGEATVVVNWIMYEPDACANRPVPPDIVAEAMTWIVFGLAVGHAIPVAEPNI